MNKLMIAILIAGTFLNSAFAAKETVYEKETITKRNDSTSSINTYRLTFFKDSVEWYDNLEEIVKHKNHKVERFQAGIGGGLNECRGKYYYKNDTVYLKMTLYRMENSNVITNPEDSCNRIAIKIKNNIVVFENTLPDTLHRKFK
jgi:hypothetical protein